MQKAGAIVGVVFLLVGALGFIPVITTNFGAVIRNGDSPHSIIGWSVRDAAGHRYRFGLRAGKQARMVSTSRTRDGHQRQRLAPQQHQTAGCCEDKPEGSSGR